MQLTPYSSCDRFFGVVYDGISMCAVADQGHCNPKMVGLQVVELGKCSFADYAAYETDYAKFSSALERSGAVVLREFITFEGSAVSGKRGVYGQNHHH